jgi:MSHA biogenesis protein MshM
MSVLLNHFGFTAHPFARKPGKKALFRHEGFQEALRRLLFCVELDGFAQVVAETGCGKSLLLGELASQLQQQGWTIHYFAHSTIGPFSLINVLARKIGVAPRRSRGETALVLAEKLIADDRKHLVILDEAHEMSDATLADVRLLTIGEFDQSSPFLLLLAGNPSLDDRLNDPTHHALEQRITTFARLQPLSLEETRKYIRMRLDAVSSRGKPLFEDAALEAVFDGAAGVPRRINNIATSSLIITAARGRKMVSAQDVQDALLDRGRP